MKILKSSLCFLTFLIVIISHAGEEKYTNFISSTAVTTSASFQVNDSKFYLIQNLPNWQAQFTNHAVQNQVILEFDKNNPIEHTSDFSVDVELYIEYIDDDLVSHNTTQTLTLDYYLDPSVSIIDRSTYVFEGGHDVTVTIQSITGTNPGNLQVRSEILVERYYTFNYASISTDLDYNYTTGAEYIEVFWEPVVGAEEYDLEWVFINDYHENSDIGTYISAASLNYNYYKNSTRITIPETSYKIPSIFDHGYVLFRVRAVGRHGTDYEMRFDGAWSANESGVISAHPAGQVIPITSEYESGNLNWGHSVFYTEGGNRKEVVEFADGLGRPRQSLNYNPVRDQVIVNNTYYDYHGRIGVSDLPTPIVNGELEFYQGFNKNASNNAYGPADFDLDYEDAQNCPEIIDPMNNSYGAAKYYSTNNADKDQFQAYVPDAEGYPFSRVEYTPDHTGRISRKSSYGVDFQLDTDHEINYSYSTPTADELINLFGVEVGEWYNNSKMLTEDANGQVYVTYYDMEGRTIATGLVGASPSGIDGLDNNIGPSTYTTTLFEGTSGQDQTTGSIVLNSSFTVDAAGDHSFEYYIEPEVFQDACMSSICFDCVYDLTIKIFGTDDCGELELVDSETHTINGLPVDNACNESATFTIASTSMEAYLESGTYFLEKSLVINEQAREDYLCLYLEDNSCLSTYQDFFNNYMTEADFSGCDLEFYDFSQSADTYCGTYKSLLLRDLYPGGQYGLCDTLGNGTYSATSYDLSIYNTSNSLPVSNADWQNPVTSYKDPDGSTSLVGGVAPENLSLNDFIDNWKDSWAESLLPYHPEYAYLEFCELNDNSHAFNTDLLAENTFSGACSSGYMDAIGSLDPTNTFPISGMSFFDNCDVTPNSTVSDPFFQTGEPGEDYLEGMIDKLDEYTTIDGYAVSAWELAVLMSTNCSDIETYSGVESCLDQYSGDDCYEDIIWQNFRNLYLTAKLEFYMLAELDYVMANGSYNGCIGETSFSSTSNSFDCYPINQTPTCSPSSYDGYSDSDQACYSGTYALYDDKIRRFPLYDENNFDEPTSAEIANLETEAEDFLEDMCTEKCEENAELWMVKLAGCGFTGTEEADIKAELIELCILGCDFENPLGSSTLATGTTTNGNASFYEVLEYHLGTGFEDELCSDLLISDPRPYGQGQTSKIIGTLDECGCDKVLQADYDFTQAPGSFNSISEMFYYQNGFAPENMGFLICTCTDAYEQGGSSWTPTSVNWTTTALDALSSADVTVPYQLSCEQCTDCSTISTKISSLDTRFSGVTNFEEQPTYNTILTNYLNNELNFDLSEDDYVEFIDACNSSSSDMYCSETPEMLSLVPILDLLVKEGKFLTTTSIDLENDNVPYPFTPFGKSRLTHEYVTNYSSAMCGGTGDLTITFGTSPSNCTMTIYQSYTGLTLPSDFCFEKLISVNSIESHDEACGNDNYTFLLDVTYMSCNGPQNTKLAGYSTCLDAIDCSCGSSGLQLCNDPYPALPFINDCYSYQIELISAAAMEDYTNYLADIKVQFREDYTAKCMEAFDTEKLDMNGVKNEYQYTLFYYDQAGNLVRTVAPRGVAQSSTTVTLTAGGDVPDYKYDTDYRYNSYNQVMHSNTPDGGEVFYWYDEFGRIRASQNAEQAPYQYAYTIYDELNRIVEVGLTEQTVGNELSEAIVKGEDIQTFEDWVAQGTQTEMTFTYYDTPLSTAISTSFKTGSQQNLRLRIATVAFYETEVVDYTTDYTSAVHYSYDVHGNVLESIQDVPLMVAVGQDKKSTQYEYDLINGHINEMVYQEDELDQVIYKYQYDGLDRLQELYTSTNGVDYDKEAKYFYYDHGPLARIERGNEKVQGSDYTYTINGWLKGINSTTLTSANDLGLDAVTGTGGNYGGIHGYMAADVFGFTLSYYEGDYSAIGTCSFEATSLSTPVGNNAADLFDGNIRYMTTSIDGFDTQASVYTYDQLQRLKEMQIYQGLDVGNNSWSTASSTNDYLTQVSYDENGNITYLDRNGIGSELDMDRFEYKYHATENNNKLYWIDDDNSTDYSTYNDIKKGMATDNYVYDNIGRLIEDPEENIDEIVWRNSDNKIKKFTRVTTANEEVEFIYNPFGMRVVKIVKPDPAVPSGWIYTYYGYDAKLRSIAVYSSELNTTDKLTVIEERHLHGTNRLGFIDQQDVLYDNGLVTQSATSIYDNLRGERKYELSNQLGNVLVVVSDRVIYDATDGYLADMSMKSDYYPFGMTMPGRHFVGEYYRYGFQGQEGDNELKGEGNSWNYKYRMHDPRIGRFFAVDPLAPKYPHNSPYAFSENSVIAFVELEGLEKVSFHSVSFAPYDYFGAPLGILQFSFRGDGRNRKFGDDLITNKEKLYYNFRTYSAVEVDLETHEITNTILGQTWSSKICLDKSTGNWSPTKFLTGPNLLSIDGVGFLSWHSRGVDKASAGISVMGKLIKDFGSIDIKNYIIFSEPVKHKRGRTKVMISGFVQGDDFPAIETYITDSEGNKIILGVSGADSGGPIENLPGTGDYSMGFFSLDIIFNKDGTFHHIETHGGKNKYRIDDWNQKFIEIDPKSEGSTSTEDGYINYVDD